MSVPTKKVRSTISINENVHSKMKEVADNYGLGMSNIMERAARYYLEKYYYADVALKRYKEGGETLTGDELDEALAKMEK